MYEVRLDAFQGPLDLLLHLIKKFEIDIYDISMKHLTEQYFHYINSMTELDINVQSEYLVMASELLRIKSKMLLPVPHEASEDDPRDELVSQLIEYQNYKYYAELLEEKRHERDQFFIKAPADLSQYERPVNEALELSVIDLMAAYQKARARKKVQVPEVTLARESYTIQQGTDLIRQRLSADGHIRFTDLFTFNESRHRLVTIFIAMLEMIKHQEIAVSQETLFGEIEIRRGKLAC
ncbi:segregation and condensation protein A [Macrococcus equipercicus]|uniref:Segregation and condensation protein A n=1 Tax=Macrococcus equipercicus TaxID=69967 RepID=A0A9Q9BRQ7_9STAP|nr:segregation/condensation protein A [Macrococcus equipercicus]KAA1040159.1 segregation/condensation protein A [Macrococcus equipercicus]UTH12894.1 segregation/condensation protein A [Macrococcus equipercicus]